MIMTKQIFSVHGMHCASCATLITKKLSKLPGVASCEVNLVSKNAELEYDQSVTSSAQLAQEVKKYGYELVIPTHDQKEELNHHVPSNEEREIIEMRKKVNVAAPLAVISILIMLRMIGADYGRRPSKLDTIDT